MVEKLVAGILLVVVGVAFLLWGKSMGEGAFKFYRVIYTKENLKIMFKAAGVILIVGGIILVAL